MSSLNSKLVLPTVETCRWRRPSGAHAQAECGLATSLMGRAAAGPVVVDDDACEACCRSFPPTRRTLNPVVAGLLHGAALRVLTLGDDPDAALALATAESALTVQTPEAYRLTPARDVLPCAWRGGPVDLADDEGPIHRCEHPDHDLASASRCQACRDWTRRRPISPRRSLDELVPPPPRRHGRPVRNWAVGVTTAPRRRPTLDGCLDGIVRAGWDAPRLFLDGTVRIPARHAHLPTSWREEAVGAWPAWFLSLTELIVQRPEADAYLMIQDDVALHDHEPLRDYLERVLWPGDRPGLVSLFHIGPEATWGWRLNVDPNRLSAQALLFPPDLARALVADPTVVRAVLDSSADHHTPIPDVLNIWLARRSIDCWHTTPSLVQHVGDVSAIWDEAALTSDRRAPWFTGGVDEAFALEEDLARFPEEAFPCDPADSDDYLRRVERGWERMRRSSVAVIANCRDARRLLPRLAARAERLGSLFEDYRITALDQGSTDATREFLDDWRASNPRVGIVESQASDIAACFQRHVIPASADFEYAVVVDAEAAGGWSYEGLAHTFGDDDWDFVGSCDLIRGPAEQTVVGPWVLKEASPSRWFAARPSEPPKRGQSMTPITTPRGGLGVHRTAYLKAGKLRSAGRLFVNPNQIALYSPE
ncbi:glycosyltransferase family protein [Paludisphaera rhizosphaerae]|uniref:hypothetical protein n=1 Tax=Paludisphaera rhizosphaerae TaxID=2711216 RepID=UPI0013EAAD3B|nr:hypothetical protein [Paludisphaera rhizosphaerae]